MGEDYLKQFLTKDCLKPDEMKEKKVRLWVSFLTSLLLLQLFYAFAFYSSAQWEFIV